MQVEDPFGGIQGMGEKPKEEEGKQEERKQQIAGMNADEQR
jgi:hypothetical protein